MPTPYQCDKHADQRALTGYCPDCVEAFRQRRNAAIMTAEERAQEFEWWGEILTIPFSDLHKRITELAGRVVWTHELDRPDLIIAEIRSGQRASFEDVLDKIPGDTPIIILDETRRG